MAKILLVEDHDAVRMAYRLLLTAAGHDVTEAPDGRAALAALAALAAGTFDLVITDLLMPDIDGFAVIAAARTRSPSSRVLAVTGGGFGPFGQDPAVRARAAGADAVIEKPMLGEGLLETVAALLQPALTA